MNRKLGYYTVDNVEFDSKIQACIFAANHDKKVSWHFNEDFFKNYNWTIEPTETLDALYDIRAKQLRETYDYVIISYSGGSDSHNIVSSFIRQGLHIDEIVVNTIEKANQKFTVIDPNNKQANNAAAEHYLQTIPRLNELSAIVPKTKITVLDMTDQLFDTWRKSEDGSWVLKKKENLHPLNVIRFNYLHFSQIRKQFDKDKKIAIVLGVEKPRTFIYEENKFYVRFVDRAANVISISDHFDQYPNAVIEYFYWSPEGADIVCKQAHTIKHWLELNPAQQKFWFYKNFTVEIYKLYQERLLRSLLYSSWNDNWYQADKALKGWHSEFDEWFIAGYKDTREYNIWKEGIDYVASHAGNYVTKDNNVPDGLEIQAHNYFVGVLDSERPRY
jgi:hypothetical protein